MISHADFDRICIALRAAPQQLNNIPFDDHIKWSEEAGPPETAEQFALEATYVICNSGMRHQAARTIYDRCDAALRAGEPTNTATRRGLGLDPIFGHDGKTFAIDDIWLQREKLLAQYLIAPDKLAFCESLPFIGKITKFHLAKNFGADVAKPDIHLDRLAKVHDTDPQTLCRLLASATGLKTRTVDLVLWMACARGVMNSTTGHFRGVA